MIGTLGSSATADEDATLGWRARRGGRSVLGIPVAALAALPLCPACYPAYAGVLGALGLTALSDTTVQTVLTVVFLFVALGALLYKATTRRGYGPFALGTAASVVLSASKFMMGIDAITYAAVGVLVLAGAWNVWPRADAVCEVPLDGAAPFHADMRG